MYCVVIASIAAGTFVQFCIFSKWSPTTLGAMSHAAVGFAYLLYFTRETWLEWEFNYPALDSILLLLSGILLGFGCHTCGGLADNCGTISTKYLGDLTAGLGIAIILATSRGSESYFRLFLAACNILTLTFIHAASRKETNAAPPPNGETPQTDEYDSTYQEYQDPIPMRFLDVLQIPSLVGLAIALGLSEIAHMLLYFWLPTILCMTYDPVTANALAATYSIGMLVGASGLVRFGNARTTLIACRALLLLPLIAASLTEFGIHLLLIIIFLPLSGLLEASAKSQLPTIVEAELARITSFPDQVSRETAKSTVHVLQWATVAMGVLPMQLEDRYGWGPMIFYVAVELACGLLLFVRITGHDFETVVLDDEGVALVEPTDAAHEPHEPTSN